jgi:hypothetical protein
MAGLTILETAAASVPTPASNKATIFIESTTGLPSYKDDAGTARTIGQSLALSLASDSTAYTFVLADANTVKLHPSADTSARTWTIPANASVAYPLGTCLTIVNQNGAGVLTISITSDTMRLAGAGTTGSRTLAANGIATAIKLTTTEWLINGTGLT